MHSPTSAGTESHSFGNALDINTSRAQANGSGFTYASTAGTPSPTGFVATCSSLYILLNNIVTGALSHKLP